MGLSLCGIIKASPLLTACIILYFPALSFGGLAKSLWGPVAQFVALLIAVGWTALIFCGLQKICCRLMADDFDWRGWWCGMIVGAIPGGILGGVFGLSSTNGPI
jgi:hypothetical protein